METSNSWTLKCFSNASNFSKGHSTRAVMWITWGESNKSFQEDTLPFSEKKKKSFQELTLTSAFTSGPTFYILSGPMILQHA